MRTRGEPTADIWIVGEYPTSLDFNKGECFQGGAGAELAICLTEAGIDPEECFYCLAHPGRPRGFQPSVYKYPEWFCTKAQAPAKQYTLYGGSKYISPELAGSFKRLADGISKYRPRLIIGCGELALLALSGQSGILDWRGSCLSIYDSKFIPTLNPDRVLKMWEWRYLLVNDLKRAAKESATADYNFPAEDYLLAPSFDEARGYLERIKCRAIAGSKDNPIPLGVDIETRRTHITCIGIAEASSKAICIPFTSHEHTHYWPLEQEQELVALLRDILSAPHVLCHGQNFWYDMQYIVRWWGFTPTYGLDTMIAWHTCYAGMKKSLSFICSMVLDGYVYWKEEGKGHEPNAEQELDYWRYNCKDACRTIALLPRLQRLITAMGQQQQVDEQMAAVAPHMKMMLRGVRRKVNGLQAEMIQQTMELINEREQEFEYYTPALVGAHQLTKTKKASPWYRSPTQQQKIFYQLFRLPVQKNKSTGRPSCDDDALQKLGKKEPLLRSIFQMLTEYRSLGVFHSTFLTPRLDWDKRIRSSYGIGMTETFRDTSSEDCFGFGGNLQNIPKGNE
jgi:uracil-DNA glycosylase